MNNSFKESTPYFNTESEYAKEYDALKAYKNCELELILKLQIWNIDDLILKDWEAEQTPEMEQ